MNIKALFKISQGMYITGAVDSTNRLVGSVIDAVMIAEMNPPQVFISLNNTSYTKEVIKETKMISLSVLPKTQTMDIIKRFGYQSSRNVDKWIDTPHEIKQGLPVVKGCVANMILKVIGVQDTSHHTVFYCDVVEADTGTMDESMTYGYYQENLLAPLKK